MAWNRTSNSQQTETALRRGGTPCPPVAAIVGVVVVLCAGLSAWWLWPNASAPVAEDGDGTVGRRIREVKPAAARTNVTEIAASKSSSGIDPNARPTRVGERVNGYVMLSDGTIHKMTGKAHTLGESQDPSQIFDNGAENEIAALLTIEPGDLIVGGPDRETFTDEFLKSLSVPIIVKSDDPEEIKELKRAVIHVKADLKAAYDRGEDIVSIIEKTYENFQRLEQYKLDLFSEVLDYSEKKDVTSDDIKDYLAAANKMLEQEGIAPLDDTPFIRTKIEYDHNIERNDK